MFLPDTVTKNPSRNTTCCVTSHFLHSTPVQLCIKYRPEHNSGNTCLHNSNNRLLGWSSSKNASASGNLTSYPFACMFLDNSHRVYKPQESAEKASGRAAELAQQLLTFAKEGAPTKKMTSVRPLVEECLSLVLRGTNVLGVLETTESLHVLEAYEGQLGQVFNNNIINAVQAMPGGERLRYQVIRNLSEKRCISTKPASLAEVFLWWMTKRWFGAWRRKCLSTLVTGLQPAATENRPSLYTTRHWNQGIRLVR